MEEFIERIAAELRVMGFNAVSWDSGGGTIGVGIAPGGSPPDELVFFFGTADTTWAGEVLDEGEVTGGLSKKNALNRPHGFLDETQGTLFFDIERIFRVKKPRFVVLENVRNMVGHDGGRTLRVVLSHLAAAGYTWNWKLLDARRYVPQSRIRLFIVATRTGQPFIFPDPPPPSEAPKVADILDKAVPDRYTLSDRLWNYLQEYSEKHRRLGHGFGFGLVNPEGVTRTLSARYHKDGSEILVPGAPGKNPRRLTPEFPNWRYACVSDSVSGMRNQSGNPICSVACWRA